MPQAAKKELGIADHMTYVFRLGSSLKFKAPKDCLGDFVMARAY